MGWKRSMGAIELIKSDLFRYAGTTSSKAFIKTYVKEAGFRFSVAFRLVNAGGVLKLFGIILWKLRNHQQIQILRKTKIGYGLSWWASDYKSDCRDRK